MSGKWTFKKVALWGSLAILGTGGAYGQAPADASFQRGAALYRSSDCAGALLELQPTSSVARTNFLLGRCYFEGRQYGKAIESLTNYRRTAPNDQAAAILLAQAQERDGHGDAGAELLEAFLKAHPDQVAVHNALGDLYARLGQEPKAMEQYSAVTSLIPEDPGARIGLGELSLREQRWKEAIDEFQRAKAVVPANFRMLLGLGTAYFRLDNCDEATGPFRQALSLDPDDFALAKMLATCYTKAQKWNELLAALRTGTPEEAADEEATAMVTKAFQATLETVKAEAYYRRVLSTSPENVTAHTDLGDLLYANKRMPDARTEYSEVVKLKPDSPRIHERLGDMAEGPGQDAEARTHFEAAAKSTRGTDSARMKLARLCFKLDDRACTAQAAAGINDPAFGPDVKLLLVQVAYKDQNWAQAGTLASELLSTDRKNLTVLRIAAEVADHQNKPLESSQLFEEALILDKGNQDLRYSLVRIYLNNDELHRLQRAVDLLTEYLSKYQQDAQGYLLLGNVYRKLNDTANAKQNFKLGVDKLTPPIPASLSWAYNSYGIMLYNEGDYDDAYVNLMQASQLNPQDQDSLLNLALTCLHLGRTDELNNARARLEQLNSKYLPDLNQEIQRQQEVVAKKGKPAR